MKTKTAVKSGGLAASWVPSVNSIRTGAADE